MRCDGRLGIRVAVKVHVLPALRPGLFGAEPDQEAQYDLGVHQSRRPANIERDRLPDGTGLFELRR